MLLERTGGRIAGIGERRLAYILPLAIQSLERTEGQPGFDPIKTRILRKEEMFVLQDRVQDVKNDNRTKVRLNAKID